MSQQPNENGVYHYHVHGGILISPVPLDPDEIATLTMSIGTSAALADLVRRLDRNRARAEESRWN